MRVYRTKGGYFYKELKNGKKTRISKEQYQKLRKKQTIKGGDRTCRMCRNPRTSNNTFYKNKNIIDLYLHRKTNINLSQYSNQGADVKSHRRGLLWTKGANNPDKLEICKTCNDKIIAFIRTLKQNSPCATCNSKGYIIEQVEHVQYISNSGNVFNSPGAHCKKDISYTPKKEVCRNCKGKGFIM
tara:strand:+ start:263 stop:817 length:555 start_codon:yes stop_codon:yes gene_type:complete